MASFDSGDIERAAESTAVEANVSLEVPEVVATEASADASISESPIAEGTPAAGASTPEPLNPCIAEDHAFIREFVSPAAILTLTNQFVACVLIRTPYSRIQVRIQYLPRYPMEAPLVEISSPSLPLPLLRNKEKVCMDLAKENLGKPQIPIIYEHLNTFIQRNLFVPCWKEIKQVMTLCEGKGQLSADEKEGVLTMRLAHGNYRQGIKLKIPPMYPEEGVQVEFTTSTFPADQQYMFRSQVEEIVRRCEAGFSPEQALTVSNPIQLPGNKVAEKQTRVTTGSLKSLKHDVGVLKQMSDLRVASTQKDKKFQYSVHANAERREARKDLRKLARAESAADQEAERQLREEEQQYMKELMKAKISDVAQPSLLAAARFLVEDYACRLPIEICQACRQLALPEDPRSEALSNPQSEMRPMRTFCGHWLHYKCLNEWLTTPPFQRQCPVCDRRIWHPDWPADHKVLEKAWQTREARKREVSDVSDFMGMGSQFSAF